MKALLSGVPMVLTPLGRDQPGVSAARAEALGVAIVVPLEQLSVRTLRAAIHEVSTEARYRERGRQVALRLRRTEWNVLACQNVEQFVRRSRAQRSSHGRARMGEDVRP